MMIELSNPPEYASTAFFTCCFIVILQHRYQDSFLGGQPVGGLVKRKRVVRVHDGVRDLKSTVSGQAMHEIRLLARLCHQSIIDLIGPENLDAFLKLVFLTHTGPYVGVERVDAFHGIEVPYTTPLFRFRRARNLSDRSRGKRILPSRRPSRGSGKRCSSRRCRRPSCLRGRSRRPSSVRISARAWQGCSQSLKAFTTGIEAKVASSSRSTCRKTRATMPSTQSDRLRARSGMVSRSPSMAFHGAQQDRPAAQLPDRHLETSRESAERASRISAR